MFFFLQNEIHSDNPEWIIRMDLLNKLLISIPLLKQREKNPVMLALVVDILATHFLPGTERSTGFYLMCSKPA